jgi:hypothetical protein
MTPAQAPDFTYSRQAVAEHFQQCAEFPLLRNRVFGPLAVTVLPIPFARRAAATACAAVQSPGPKNGLLCGARSGRRRTQGLSQLLGICILPSASVVAHEVPAARVAEYLDVFDTRRWRALVA